MIYTKLTKMAMRLCFEKHKNRIDKSGVPYVFHPFHVAESMSDEYTTCTALLHDIVEDTDTTLDDLKNMGFPDEVVEAVGAMTHYPDVPYMEYIEKLKPNRIARAVKISDLMHNCDLSRNDEITDEDIIRTEKYKRALALLWEDG